jgi:hypothetical protein
VYDKKHEKLIGVKYIILIFKLGEIKSNQQEVGYLLNYLGKIHTIVHMLNWERDFIAVMNTTNEMQLYRLIYYS